MVLSFLLRPDSIVTASFAVEAHSISGISAGFNRYLRNLIPEMLKVMAEEGRDERLVMLCRPGRQPYREAFPIDDSLTWQAWCRGLWPPRKPYSAILCPTHRIPQWRRPIVATIHDFYDEFGVGFHRQRDVDRAIELRNRLILRANRLLCISEATQADLLHFHPEAAAKSCVVRLGVDPAFSRVEVDRVLRLRERLQLQRPYLLYIGANRRNKNLARLIEAFDKAPERHDFDLVIAGPMLTADGDPAVAVALAGLRTGTTVRHVGFVADEDLPTLYSGAEAFLFPSLREGFGLPILEAMKCGTPVMTSLGSACEETAGGHAVLVDPWSIDSIIDGIGQAVRYPRQGLAAAEAHATRYSWRQAAIATLAELRWSAAAEMS
jgi:glycosyltransferase involved in cell wall biosynthesis